MQDATGLDRLKLGPVRVWALVVPDVVVPYGAVELGELVREDLSVALAGDGCRLRAVGRPAQLAAIPGLMPSRLMPVVDGERDGHESQREKEQAARNRDTATGPDRGSIRHDESYRRGAGHCSQSGVERSGASAAPRPGGLLPQTP